MATRWPAEPFCCDGVMIEEVAYHRNGVGGVGFHVVKFSEPDEERRMLAVAFDTDDFGYCAVFNRSLLAQDVIEFGVNSWRGDRYEKAMRKAIDLYTARPMPWETPDGS